MTILFKLDLTAYSITIIIISMPNKDYKHHHLGGEYIKNCLEDPNPLHNPIH